METLIPITEHGFQMAWISKGKLRLRLSWEQDETEMVTYHYFLGIDLDGRMERVISIVDLLDDEATGERFPRDGEEFPIYGLREAGELYAKYQWSIAASEF